jgi:hypothetical protein
VFTKDYWKVHPELVSGATMSLGNLLYSGSDLVSILNAAPQGNGLISLAQQLIAANLNQTQGNAALWLINLTVAEANYRIGFNVVPPVGSGFIPPNQVSALVNALSDFNSGLVDFECDGFASPCIAQRDLGDAPEGTSAYSSGVVGRFPSCISDTPAGTSQVECGAAGPTPGTVGVVIHTGNGPALGCGLGPDSFEGALDTEFAPKTNSAAGSATSACDPAVVVDCSESAFGMTFGQDECTGSADAALSAPLSLTACSQTSFRFLASNCNQEETVYLNVLVDMNEDGDWNDVMACSGTCAPEWAVRNSQYVLPLGCSTLETPPLQVGEHVGESWLRLTLTLAPVPDDFPWNGSRSAPNGVFSDGETEDYPIHIVEAAGVVGAHPRFGLSPLAPNPTRAAVELGFTLDRAGDAEIGIFSVDGRRIRRLTSGPQPAGPGHVRWDGRDDRGSDAPPGLYWVRLRSGGQVATRALIRVGS